MANPKIEVDITGDAKGLQKAAKDAQEAIDKVDKSVGKTGAGAGKLGKLDDAVRGLADDRLGPLAEAADMAGVEIGAMSTAAMAGGAAIVGLGAFVAQGIGNLTEMVDEVRRFKDASGATWDESSRLVAVMDDLGVNADSGAAAMARLAKNVDAGVLKDFGVAVVTADDGSVNLVETLGNVADQFASTTDPAKRAALASAVFGKSWVDLAPLLNKGSAGISELMSGVADYQLVTEESAAKTKEYQLALDNLQDAWKGASTQAAEDLIPAFTNLLVAATPLIELFGKTLPVAMVPLIDTISRAGTGMRWLMDKLGLADAGALDLAKSTGDLTDATTETTAATKEEADALKKVESAQRAAKTATEGLNKEIDRQLKGLTDQRNAILESTNKDIAFERQQRRTSDAMAELATAKEEMDKLLWDGVAVTDKAKEAEREYQEKLSDAQEQALTMAAAAEAVAAAHAAEVDPAHAAAAGAEAYRKKLKDLRDAATDPAMIAFLDGMIGKLDAQAEAARKAAEKLGWLRDQVAKFGINQVAGNLAELGIPLDPAALVPKTGQADGGPVAAGTPYLVGEMGPEVFVPQRNGTIVPNNMLGGQTVHINVNSPIGRPDDVVRWLSSELLRLDRSKR